MKVADIMTAPVLTVQPETTVEKCMQLMTERRVRHPVDRAQERQRVRVPVEHGDQRSGEGGREHLVEDPRGRLGLPLPGEQRLEEQPGTGHAHDVGLRAHHGARRRARSSIDPNSVRSV